MNTFDDKTIAAFIALNVEIEKDSDEIQVEKTLDFLERFDLEMTAKLRAGEKEISVDKVLDIPWHVLATMLDAGELHSDTMAALIMRYDDVYSRKLAVIKLLLFIENAKRLLEGY